ncbi:MAG: hypothetical protein WD579_01410 [Candidatus Paceibacterota bacterium]
MIKKEYVNFDKISRLNIDIPREVLTKLAKKMQISLVTPFVNDRDYPFKDSFLGEWEVEVLRPNTKMKFKDIVELCKQDGYSPATVFHVLSLVKTIKNLDKYQSFMAPGSFCVDDFEYIGCVVLNNNAKGLSLGVGNWRGSKIGGYDILRTKKLMQSEEESIGLPHTQ